MKKPLVLVGDSKFAEIAYEYFTYDSDYRVVAFAVEKTHRTRDELMGLPVVDLEALEEDYRPDTHSVHVAVVYTQLNRLRRRLYENVKGRGYECANYISSKAFVWRNVAVGDNVFVFEDNTVQPFVQLGSNIVLWSGNHIGHHSTIKDHNFVSSHVVISGNTTIGESCFIGVNACFANDIEIGADCFFALGAAVTRSTERGGFYHGNPAEKHPRRTAYDAMRVPQELRQ